MTEDEINQYYDAYVKRFEEFPPLPMCVDQESILEQVIIALKKDRPIPKNFNWYKKLPPGAVA